MPILERPTPKQQHGLTQISSPSVLGGNLKRGKPAALANIFLSQDLRAFLDPVCFSSPPILGNEMKTIIKLNPFISQLESLNGRFQNEVCELLYLSYKQKRDEVQRKWASSELFKIKNFSVHDYIQIL